MNSNTYIIKAIDCYPYNLEDCIESLNFALSYDDEHPIALSLMGRVQSEVMKDYAAAVYYFEKALAADTRYLETYYYFISTLLTVNQLDKAQKLIDFALTIPGIEQARILLIQIQLLERKGELKKAMKQLDSAILASTSVDQLEEIDEIKSRIERKQGLKKKKTK